MKLSQLFGDKTDLFIVHNMGAKCSSCTMWADGLNGVYPHLADRASFVIASPDAPSVQRAFAGDRGWRFPMVPDTDAKFGLAMGYTDPKNPTSLRPGISVFRKDGDKIIRMSDTGLGPRDDFCIVRHLLDLLPEGSDSFRPKFRYFAN